MTSCSSAVPPTDSPDSSGGGSPVVSVFAVIFSLATLRLCDVLASAEVEAAFGEPVTVDDANTGECWWETKITLKQIVIKRDSAPDSPEALAERRRGFDNSSWKRSTWGPTDSGQRGALRRLAHRSAPIRGEHYVEYQGRPVPDRREIGPSRRQPDRAPELTRSPST